VKAAPLRTESKPGTVRVAIYKRLKARETPWYWATCDCGWDTSETTDGEAVSAKAIDHLRNCLGML
jgi:hypothetical protein